MITQAATPLSGLPERVHGEVGPRDGLQNEDVVTWLRPRLSSSEDLLLRA